MCAVGSSSSITCADCANARAIKTRWRSPPLIWPNLLSANSVHDVDSVARSIISGSASPQANLPMAIISRTVKSNMGSSCCGTTDIFFAASRAVSEYISLPNSSAAPDFGGSVRESERINVDLPEPFGPMMARTSPKRSCTETSFRTILPS